MTLSGELPFRIGPKDLPSLSQTACFDSHVSKTMRDTKVPNIYPRHGFPWGVSTEVSGEFGMVKLRHAARPVLIMRTAVSILRQKAIK